MTSARFAAVILVLAIATPALAGCISKRPVLHVAITGGTGLLDEFANLDLVLKDVYVQQGEKPAVTFDVTKTVDLVQVSSGRSAELIAKPFDADTYERVGVELNTVRATTLDGQSVRVNAFNDKLYAVTAFHLENGKEATFLLAITVAKDKTGAYFLRPVQGESSVR